MRLGTLQKLTANLPDVIPAKGIQESAPLWPWLVGAGLVGTLIVVVVRRA